MEAYESSGSEYISSTTSVESDSSSSLLDLNKGVKTYARKDKTSTSKTDPAIFSKTTDMIINEPSTSKVTFNLHMETTESISSFNCRCKNANKILNLE